MFNLEKTLTFLKKNKLWLKAVCFAFLPWLACFISCRLQGYSISDVYLPASQWNDELFYFKQVEGIMNYGYPYGYFGFNESRADMLSFAAWSPVLVFPWLVLSLFFGWSLMSPVWFNIILMGLAMFLFVMLVQPGRKQLGILTLLFLTFTPITRFTLSGMPEAICFSMLILFYALSYSYLKEEKKWKLILQFVLSALMTLMRPYLILFLLLPCAFWIYKNRKAGIIASILIIGATGVLYAAINSLLGADYFTPLFNTAWITTFIEEGIFAGIYNMLRQLWTMGRSFLQYALEGIRSGFIPGAYFAAFLLMLLILLYQTYKNIRKKNYKQAILNGHLTFCFVGMWAALLLMYKLMEGGRHLLTFMAVGIVAVSVMETRFYKKSMILCLAFAYLFTYKASDAYEYQVPFATQELKANLSYWEETFSSELILDTSQKPSYENVVIWPYNDKKTNEAGVFDWQILYALPAGFGISCCQVDYVMENLDSLESRYVAAVPGGELDAMCAERNYEIIGRMNDVVVYRRK